MTSISSNIATGSAFASAHVQSAVRKAAWRFIPLIALAYFFNDLDRTSVGFAALTMNRDLGLTATQFGWGAGIMFAGYCVFEVPSNLALYRFGGPRWLARIVITWGFFAAATALAVGPKSFYAIRLLLGIGEAGFWSFDRAGYHDLADLFPLRLRSRRLRMEPRPSFRRPQVLGALATSMLLPAISARLAFAKEETHSVSITNN